jgi:Uma2 family endonuclease
MTITSLDQLNLSKQYTHSDYFKCGIEDRLELIRGHIRQMAAPSREHQAISRNLGRQIDSCFLVENVNDIQLPLTFDFRDLTK